MSKFDEALEWLIKWKMEPMEFSNRARGGFVNKQQAITYGHYETIRTALTQAAEIERGDKVVVPREPTRDMEEAGSRVEKRLYYPNEIYKAMITASEDKQ